MKKKELKAQQPNELKEKLAELKKMLVKENAQIAIGTLPKDPGKIKHAKRTIARIYTIIGGKKAQ
ncbi:50S ribosomal protein L29 [Candidatus Woesearchaeota archaeon]|nr:50S ribosomal protein L29 [Candidatus Woesearchaeota archaeon]